jgi:hypothetical protein
VLAETASALHGWPDGYIRKELAAERLGRALINAQIAAGYAFGSASFPPGAISDAGTVMAIIARRHGLRPFSLCGGDHRVVVVFGVVDLAFDLGTRGLADCGVAVGWRGDRSSW